MGRNKKAPGSFERRGTSWRWRVCVGGVYHRFTIRTSERHAAEAWARKKFEELTRTATRKADGLAVGVRFSDLLTYFEAERLPRLAPGAQRSYRDCLKPIRAYFVDREGDVALDSVRPKHIIDYLDWREGHRLLGNQTSHRAGDAGAIGESPRPLHLRTVAKDRTMLRRLFAVAAEREWREAANPVTKATTVTKPDAREYVILTGEQFDALLGACREPAVRLYLLVLAETGARCESEALWLKWEDVDLAAGFVRVVTGRDGHRTKGGKSRDVPMTPRLVAAFREHVGAHRSAAYPDRDGTMRRPAFVFHHVVTRRTARAGERVKSYRGSVERAARLAKLPAGWRMHDLRHRRVTSWLAEGQSPALVQKALGHADLATTMHYAHLVREDLRALVTPPTPPTVSATPTPAPKPAPDTGQKFGHIARRISVKGRNRTQNGHSRTRMTATP